MELEAARRRFQLWFCGLRSLRRDLRTARWADPAQLAVGGRLRVPLRRLLRGARGAGPGVDAGGAVGEPVERGAAHWLAGWRPTTLVHLLYTESAAA
ncbi:hypothetical protein ZWY2020_045113 [Hordeum vulgare]|nr:hypothetical protein ZWY2020_045113 [Hordeum vulgare]